VEPVFDVLVIGGGVAGVTAALEAAAAGASVAVVRAGPGATALASGAWDGPLPPMLARALADSGLPHVAVEDLLPHPFGWLRRAGFAAESQARAQAGTDACVCGIAGLPGFRASALARLWEVPRHATIHLAATPQGGWSPVSLAAMLDRDPAPLSEELARVGSGVRAILPAVLGLAPGTRARIAAAAGVEVGEALGVPPSVPGWRLDRALRSALDRAGVTVVEGRVSGRAVRGDRIESVAVVTGPDLTHRYAAESFVLATGRYLGGGITASPLSDRVEVAHGQALREAELAEPALGCDVWVNHLGERFTKVEPVTLTDPVRNEPQALLRAGVHVDSRGRPVSRLDRVRYANVVARGSVIAETSHGLGFAATGALP